MGCVCLWKGLMEICLGRNWMKCAYLWRGWHQCGMPTCEEDLWQYAQEKIGWNASAWKYESIWLYSHIEMYDQKMKCVSNERYLRRPSRSTVYFWIGFFSGEIFMTEMIFMTRVL